MYGHGERAAPAPEWADAARPDAPLTTLDGVAAKATGVEPFDAPKAQLDANIPAADKHKIFEANARRVYPRLDAQLKARGR